MLAERIASQLEQRVLIVEIRNHIGGNAYDYYNEHGHLVHKYGPHIFHTRSKEVWDYLSRFPQWRPYYHHVLAVVEGKKVPIPFNLNTLYALFPPSYAEKLEGLLLENFGFGKKIPILQLKKSSSGDLCRYLATFLPSVSRVQRPRFTKDLWQYDCPADGLSLPTVDPTTDSAHPHAKAESR